MATVKPTITTINDTFTEFKDNVNTISLDVGATGRLTTLIDSDVVSAINELDSDLHGSGGGDVSSDLNYISYAENSVRDSGIVGAINAIDAFIGHDSAELPTTAKTIISAIKELDIDIHGAGGGTASSDLDTTANDLVAAINEIESVFDASATEITSGSNFDVNVTGNFTVDASVDIYLDADMGNVHLQNNGIEFGKFTDSGTQLAILSNGQKFFKANNTNGEFQNNLTVKNTLDVTGQSNLNGHVNLGNATGDNISVVGRVDTNIVPSTDGTRDLGSASLEWKDAFFDGTVTTDALVSVTADLGNFDITTDTITNPNNTILDIGGNLEVNVDGGDVVFKDATATFGSLNNTSGNLIVKSGTTTALTFSGANVTTGGTVQTGGNLTMGGSTIARTGALTLDASTTIHVDAGNGVVNLKKAGTLYGSLVDSAEDLVIKSGSTTAATFDGANVTFAGTVNVGTLNTTANDVRAAINEHESNLGTMSLDTSASNVTAAINELHTSVGSAIGSTHNTTTNDIGASLNSLDSAVGNLAGFDATDVSDHSNLVNAINAVGGDVTQLSGDASALDGRIGSLSNLVAGFTGAERTSIVNALNALYNAMPDIYDESGTLLN